MVSIAVIGLGYVGLANAVLFAQKNNVFAYDINNKVVSSINNRISHIKDEYIETYLNEERLNLKAFSELNEALKEVKFALIATPTNYDSEKGCFDTSSVEETLAKIHDINRDVIVIIKSTVPVGFTKSMQEKYKDMKILFSPEFIREGKALYDNLYPSRIIISDDGNEAGEYIHLLMEVIIKKDVNVLFVKPTEAETIKLFSNSYLALRVAFFNELDTFAEIRGLDSKEIIEGVGLDPRIGDHYNNPSFGYGGYCLPKDTKQLLANYESVPQKIIEAIIESNETRKKHIVEMIKLRNPKIVGVYHLGMKKESDNFRESSIIDIMESIHNEGIEVLIYEPAIKEDFFKGLKVIKDFDEFINMTDLIIANRLTKELKNRKSKVYSRDLFYRD